MGDWTRKIGIGLLGLTAVVGLAAFRGGPGGMRGHEPEGFFGARIEDMLDDVDATPQQRERIRAIADRLRERRSEARTAHRAEREKLVAQWEAGTLDRAQLVAQVDARAEHMKAFGREVADAVVEVQGILTPEQRAKVAKKMRRHAERGNRGPPAREN